jgi:hypothetical protein
MPDELSLEELLSLYCSYMREVKERLIVIQRKVNENSDEPFSFVQPELLAINFRKILELIAFSTLSANKELYAKVHSNFARHWNAKRLLNSLESVNPAFYPRPVTPTRDQESGIIHLEDIPDGFLNKSDFIRLYDMCGVILHVSNPFGNPNWPDGSMFSIGAWCDLIWKLLETHLVEFADRGGIWLIEMEDSEDGDVKRYIIAERN